jgi:hypothetical protein
MANIDPKEIILNIKMEYRGLVIEAYLGPHGYVLLHLHNIEEKMNSTPIILEMQLLWSEKDIIQLVWWLGC